MCFAYHDTTSVARIEWVGAAASISVGLVMILLWGVRGAAWAVPLYFGIQLIFAVFVVLSPSSEELEGGRFKVESHNNQ